jgi:uncharacterized protein YbjT (DUF2867 family)
MTTVLVAGATGAVGSALIPALRQSGFQAIPHVRPKTAERHPLGKDPDALVCDLADSEKLDQAMRRCQAVVCSVGTMRRRFAQGDTYESSDYLPVVQLVQSIQRMSEPRYFVLVSALGARPGKGYLGWKHRAEEVVRTIGIPHAILRPSFLDTAGTAAQPSDGKSRSPPPLVGSLLRGLGALPGLKGASDDFRPIPVDVLCSAIVALLRQARNLDEVQTGRHLWPLARGA